MRETVSDRERERERVRETVSDRERERGAKLIGK